MRLLQYFLRLYSLARYELRNVIPPRRREFRKCGERVFSHHHVRFATCDQISLGDDIYFGPYCRIFGEGGLSIGSGTVLGENVTLIASNHRFEGADLLMRPFDNGLSKKGIDIGRNVWIGQNALVLPGVRLADGSVIGAGSVVTHDTQTNGIYAGQPARMIRMRDLPENFDILPAWVAGKSKLKRFFI